MFNSVYITITNCCYMRGGSKVPYRIRKYQNYGMWIDKGTLLLPHKQLLQAVKQRLPIGVRVTSTSKVKVPKTKGYE